MIRRCSLLLSGLTACAVGQDDGVQFTGPTSASTMYGSSGGSGEAESGETSSTTDDPTTGSTTDPSTSDATTGDATTAGDGDASGDTMDASSEATDSTATGGTDTSTDATDASTDTTDASTDTTDTSTDGTDTSTDTTGGDGDGDTGGAMCGNGSLESGEDCDDGNASNNDGCSSACTWESNCGSDNPQPNIACGGQGNGNMSGAYSDVDDPVCGQTFAWQDRVYVFTPQTSGSVTATFTSSPDPGDGAIVVMEGSCHSQLCIASSVQSGDYHSVTWDAIAGLTYYIDLELPSQQPSFTISLSCS